MEKENWVIFEKLEQLKVKAGETLRTSYFKSGGKEPQFAITEKMDGTLTLYRVNGKALEKMQSSSGVAALEAVILPLLK